MEYSVVVVVMVKNNREEEETCEWRKTYVRSKSHILSFNLESLF